MRWTQVRQLVEATFAESVRRHVTIGSTIYRRSSFGNSYGRGWITVDGIEVASFDDHIVARLFGEPSSQEFDPTGFYGKWFRASCFEYSHSSLNASVRSPNPLIRSLAVLNAKVGRARLARLAASEEHPLPKALANFRIEAEAAARTPAAAATAS